MSKIVKKLEQLLLQALLSDSDEELLKNINLVNECSYTVSDKQLEESKIKVEKQYELLSKHTMGTLH